MECSEAECEIDALIVHGIEKHVEHLIREHVLDCSRCKIIYEEAIHLKEIIDALHLDLPDDDNKHVHTLSSIAKDIKRLFKQV